VSFYAVRKLCCRALLIATENVLFTSVKDYMLVTMHGGSEGGPSKCGQACASGQIANVVILQQLLPLLLTPLQVLRPHQLLVFRNLDVQTSCI
jgi:hypothetical protein